VIHLATEAKNGLGAGICAIRETGKPGYFYTDGPCDLTAGKDHVQQQVENAKATVTTFKHHFNPGSRIFISCRMDLRLSGPHAASEAKSFHKQLDQIRESRGGKIEFIIQVADNFPETLASEALLKHHKARCNDLMQRNGLKPGKSKK